MSTNTSLILNDIELSNAVPKFVAYVIEGLLISITNLTIFIAIMRYYLTRSRNDNIILAAMMLTDGLNGLACFLAGSARLWMIYRDIANRLVTSLHCLLMPWNLIWIITEQNYGTVLSLVSLDRLIMTAKPLDYYGFTNKYPFIIIAVSHVPYLVSITYLAGSLLTSDLISDKPQICFTDWAYNNPTYYHIAYTQNVIMACVSVALYVIVVIRYRMNKNKVMPAHSQAVAERLKDQRRLTITVGFSCTCTFVFHILPLIVKQLMMIADRSNQSVAFIVPLIYIIQNFNPLANVGIYIVRHKDLRVAVKCLFKCKNLTAAMMESEENNEKLQIKRPKPKRKDDDLIEIQV